MLKSYGVVVVVGVPCYYRVSPSPFGLDFGTWDFGTSDSGLTIIQGVRGIVASGIVLL